MIGKFKRKIAGKITNILRSAVRREIEDALPIIPQLIEFQNSAKEDRQSFYDHTKDPLGSIGFYEGLKDRLLSAGVPITSMDMDIHDFEQWSNFSRLISTPLFMQSQVPDCKKQRVDVGHRESLNILFYHNVKRNSTKK